LDPTLSGKVEVAVAKVTDLVVSGWASPFEKAACSGTTPWSGSCSGSSYSLIRSLPLDPGDRSRTMRKTTGR
jgi:hypothetical protein